MAVNKRIEHIFQLLIFLLILAVGAAGYFYWQYREIKKSPQAFTEKAADNIVAEVARLMVLPDEVPTVANVTDPEKLKDQPFFANAKVGYKVLIFSNAKKAILYDPEKKVVINVAPINLGGN